MRYLAIILLTSVLAGCGIAPAADKIDDAKSWQGTWNMVSCTWNGQPQPEKVQWIVEGDHYNIRLDDVLDTDPYSFTLDPAKKRIDVFHHYTPSGSWGGSWKGIYELKGNSLKVCYELKGQRYPNSFDASFGWGRVIYEFERQR